MPRLQSLQQRTPSDPSTPNPHAIATTTKYPRVHEYILIETRLSYRPLPETSPPRPSPKKDSAKRFHQTTDTCAHTSLQKAARQHVCRPTLPHPFETVLCFESHRDDVRSCPKETTHMTCKTKQRIRKAPLRSSSKLRSLTSAPIPHTPAPG